MISKTSLDSRTSVDSTADRSRRSFVRRFVTGAGAAAVTVPVLSSEARAMPGKDPFVGEVAIFAGSFAPRGWAFCEGQTLSVQQNAALFSILGTKYGGDGKSNFRLPDLKKQAKNLGLNYIIALEGVYPSRN